MQFITSFVALLTLVASTVAAPVDTVVYPRLTAVSNVKCTSSKGLDTHSVNVAQLQICGGIAGAITKCQGNPTSTTGTSGHAQFSIVPVLKGATINVSKGRFEQGIKAVAAICGASKPFTATFALGASNGDINVALRAI